MGKRIVLQAATRDLEVVLRDQALDADRKYLLRPLTRSKKRELQALQGRAAEVGDIEGDDVTEEQEAEVMRLLCDMVNVLLVGVDDAPGAGDLLFSGWEAEKITDEQIISLVNDLAGEPVDPT